LPLTDYFSLSNSKPFRKIVLFLTSSCNFGAVRV
jgi:hypothetical protein